MWKYENFPATQILREINFGSLLSQKNSHLGSISRKIWETQNFFILSTKVISRIFFIFQPFSMMILTELVPRFWLNWKILMTTQKIKIFLSSNWILIMTTRIFWRDMEFLKNCLNLHYLKMNNLCRWEISQCGNELFFLQLWFSVKF